MERRLISQSIAIDDAIRLHAVARPRDVNVDKLLTDAGANARTAAS
jgi:hypothetical protein